MKIAFIVGALGLIASITLILFVEVMAPDNFLVLLFGHAMAAFSLLVLTGTTIVWLILKLISLLRK
jgi:hypothetical protein